MGDGLPYTFDVDGLPHCKECGQVVRVEIRTKRGRAVHMLFDPAGSIWPHDCSEE